MPASRLARNALLALLVSLPLLADGELRVASIGNLTLLSGETLRDCKIGYRTYGKLNASRSNAILFPTWFSGTSDALAAFVGAGSFVDPSRYFLITVDALANGVSSSPSNQALQPRMKFPRIAIADMVRSQHALLTQVLGIQRLHAVIGISMGGMQAFEWAVSYPDFASRSIPIIGSPRLSAFDVMVWKAEERAIQSDPAWRGGDYAAQPAEGLRGASDIHEMALRTPEFHHRHTQAKLVEGILTDSARKLAAGMDANNWLRQLQAMMAQDVARNFAGNMSSAAAAVKARMLVIVSAQDHMVTPFAALDFARSAKAERMELESECGHLVTGCEMAKIGEAVRRFLAQ